jgi:hypothetical protein
MHARQRKMQQEYANHKSPPSIASLWICAFCEYEAVYGRPPRAFIQRYEIRDYKEEQRKAERRRLLEKAKIKGRKGKKAAANAAKQAHKNLAHQAAEFQKNEMLRHTKELQNHRTQLQQAHRDLQAHNAQAVAGMQQNYQQPQDQLYDDEDEDDDDDDDDLEYDEGEYDDEDEDDDEEGDDDGDTEELDDYLNDPGPPPLLMEPPPQPPLVSAGALKGRSGR